MTEHPNNASFKVQMIPEENFNSRLNQLEGTLNKILEVVRGISGENGIPNMLTSDQVMETLNIKRWKFDQLIADGELQYIRKGRKIYVYESAIREYFGLK